VLEGSQASSARPCARSRVEMETLRGGNSGLKQGPRNFDLIFLLICVIWKDISWSLESGC
jgi:hypothetical protein